MSLNHLRENEFGNSQGRVDVLCRRAMESVRKMSVNDKSRYRTLTTWMMFAASVSEVKAKGTGM